MTRLLALVFAAGIACAAPGGPGILLVTADTLRADHLGCYGSRLGASPALDRLAEGALVFDDCLCNVPLTGPACAAMMTSLPPRTTGATRNGLPVAPGIPTVAELLRAAGWHTFCVQSTWTLKAKLSGLDRGFAVYDQDFHYRRWGVTGAERPAGKVTDAALRLLRQCPADKPFFGWVHYIDPHAPYRMHRRFDPWGKPQNALTPRDQLRARYASEVAFMDQELGRLLGALPPETVVVFTADHGESLFEHNYLGHGRRVYHDNLRVPLMLRAPGVAPGRSAVPAQGMDIAPTLLGLAGVAVAPGMEGVDLLRNPPGDGRPRFFETYGGAVPHLPGLRKMMANAGPSHQGVLARGWKLILPGKGPAELYRMTEDPGEEHCRAGDETDRVGALSKDLAAWTRQHPPLGPPVSAALDAEDVAALRSLGYGK
jgi:arylsulfatase A-like enzyme